MKGGHVHERVLLDPLEEAGKRLGLRVLRPAPVNVGGQTRFGDLLLETEGIRLLVEVELSHRRVRSDLLKAAALGATSLWIVVPTLRVARAVIRQLGRLEFLGGAQIEVLLLEPALQRLAHLFSPDFRGDSGGKTIEKSNRR